MVPGLTVNSQSYQFDIIEEVPGKNQAQLYKSAKLAVTELFKSAKDVIQLDDQESGTLVLNGNMEYSYSKPNFTCNKTTDGRVDFTLKILTKDDKYRLIFEEFTHHSSLGTADLGLIGDTNAPPASWLGTKKCGENVIADIKIKCENTVQGFRERFKKIVAKEEDDW